MTEYSPHTQEDHTARFCAKYGVCRHSTDDDNQLYCRNNKKVLNPSAHGCRQTLAMIGCGAALHVLIIVILIYMVWVLPLWSQPAKYLYDCIHRGELCVFRSLERGGCPRVKTASENLHGHRDHAHKKRCGCLPGALWGAGYMGGHRDGGGMNLKIGVTYYRHIHISSALARQDSPPVFFSCRFHIAPGSSSN